MERDLALADHRNKPSYLTGRYFGSPSSCFSMVHKETDYARISDHHKKARSSLGLKDLVRRLLLVKSYGFHDTKPKTLMEFHYDAVSYAKNFDDGLCLRDDDRKILRDRVIQSSGH